MSLWALLTGILLLGCTTASCRQLKQAVSACCGDVSGAPPLAALLVFEASEQECSAITSDFEETTVVDPGNEMCIIALPVTCESLPTTTVQQLSISECTQEILSDAAQLWEGVPTNAMMVLGIRVSHD